MKRQRVLFLNRGSDLSLQVQLAARLKGLIQSGQMGAGDPLPSSRELAAELKVSRNTVVYAYERLISEGYLSSRLRSRVFVSDTAPALRSAAQRSQSHRDLPPLAHHAAAVAQICSQIFAQRPEAKNRIRVVVQQAAARITQQTSAQPVPQGQRKQLHVWLAGAKWLGACRIDGLWHRKYRAQIAMTLRALRG